MYLLLSVGQLFFFAIVISVLPSPVYAFEPLNTDDAATIGKSVNQIEQYFYVLHNNTPGNPGSVATPGEEFRGIGNAKAFPDRKSTRLNSSHVSESRMPSSA